MTLSVGKMRGLQGVANGRQCFTILAVDHGASFAESMRPADPGSVTVEEATAVKGEMIEALAPSASAVLVDPLYGLGPAVLGGRLPGAVGLLAPVEDQDYATKERRARLLERWGVAQAQRAGVDAIKFFFYYHPDDGEVTAHQEALVRRLVADCQQADLPFFAEPIVYGVRAETRREVVVASARRISRLGIDVLKVEFPVDVHVEADERVWAEACAQLSAACVTPWALLSAGVDFPTFARQLAVACRAGASGYLAGRAVWKEGVLLDGDERVAFWEQTARVRLERLAEIANEHGRPWTDFYPYQTEAPAPDWYESKGEV